MTNEEAEKILMDAERRAQGQTTLATAATATATGSPAQTVTIDAASFAQMQQHDNSCSVPCGAAMPSGRLAGLRHEVHAGVAD